MEDKDSPSATSREPEGLTALFTKMADELTQLFDIKLTLLKAETKQATCLETMRRALVYYVTAS